MINPEIVKIFKDKLKVHSEKCLDDLIVRLKPMAKQSDDVCPNLDCVKEIRPLLRDLNIALAEMALNHGLDPHDFINEVLLMTIEGNNYAKTIQESANAFQNDEVIGFC